MSRGSANTQSIRGGRAAINSVREQRPFRRAGDGGRADRNSRAAAGGQNLVPYAAVTEKREPRARLPERIFLVRLAALGGMA